MQQSRKYVADYLKEQTDQTDLPLDKVTPQLIHDFSVWLSAVRQLRGGTVWLVCQQLKGVVTRAHQRGKIMWNPFGGFHIAKKIRPRQYLTEEELGKLMAINKGVPIETVSRILGHTNITTTQIYAKITIDKICSDMMNFEDQLNHLLTNHNPNQSKEDS